MKEREEHLKHKKGDLDAILAETEEESSSGKKNRKNTKPRLRSVWGILHQNPHQCKNGLAVVAIERGASELVFYDSTTSTSGGARAKKSYRQYSGRILVDTELAEEQRVKMEKLFSM